MDDLRDDRVYLINFVKTEFVYLLIFM